MKKKFFKKPLYACLSLVVLSSSLSCSKADEVITESANIELNANATTAVNGSIPDPTYHPAIYVLDGIHYISMFNGAKYTTASKPRRVIVTYDTSIYQNVFIKTVNKTYQLRYEIWQDKPYTTEKPLMLKFKLVKTTNNGTQYAIYNNLDQLVVDFIAKTHALTTPNSGELRFGKNDIQSTINAYFLIY